VVSFFLPTTDHSDETTVQITLFQRTYPVDGAPVTLSVVPFTVGQKCTFPVGDTVHEATYSEVRIVAPDDAMVDRMRNRLTWGDGGKSRAKSTATEVLDLALAGNSGFRLEK
jgi:hypothetical protein